MRARHLRADLNLCTSTPMMEELHSHGIDRLALWERAVDRAAIPPVEVLRCDAQYSERRRAAKTAAALRGPAVGGKDIDPLREVAWRAMPETRLAIVGDGPTAHELERHFRGTGGSFAGYMERRGTGCCLRFSRLVRDAVEDGNAGTGSDGAWPAAALFVACRAGGIPDAVEDGVTGFLFDPSGQDALVRRCGARLANPAECAAVTCARTGRCGAAQLEKVDRATQAILHAGHGAPRAESDNGWSEKAGWAVKEDGSCFACGSYFRDGAGS